MSEALCGRPHNASYADLRIMPTWWVGARRLGDAYQRDEVGIIADGRVAIDHLLRVLDGRRRRWSTRIGLACAGRWSRMPIGLRGELERLGYTPLSAAGHGAVGRAPEPLDDPMSDLSSIGVDAGNGGRVLRRAPRGRVTTTRSRPGRCGHCWITCKSLGRPGGARAGGLRRLHASGCWTAIATTCFAERGLAASTVELNVRMVRPFLADQRVGC